MCGATNFVTRSNARILQDGAMTAGTTSRINDPPRRLWVKQRSDAKKGLAPVCAGEARRGHVRPTSASARCDAASADVVARYALVIRRSCHGEGRRVPPPFVDQDSCGPTYSAGWPDDDIFAH